MNRLNRLSRLPSKLKTYFVDMLRESRKEYREMVYDMKRIQKKTLETIYNSILLVSSMGTTSLYLLYNTYYLEENKTKFGLKVSDTLLPLDEDLELLAIREFNVCHIARHYKLMNLLQFFPCDGSEIFSAGDLETRTGAVMGLPYNLTYNSVSDIKPNELKIYGLNTNSNKDLIQKLIDSLVLSENAKKFAITREIHFLTNHRTVAEALNICFSTFLGIGIAHQTILSFNIRRNPLLSLSIRLIALTIGLCIWFVVQQSIYYQYYTTADADAIEQGVNYYDGAVEYYEKLLQKNKILYQLLDKRGKKMFTPDGEVKGLFRFNSLSIRKRLNLIYELNPRKGEKSDDSEHIITNASEK